MRRARFYFIAALLVLPSLAAHAQAKQGNNSIRVCVLKNVASLKLTLDGRYAIYSLQNNEVIKAGKSLYKVTVNAVDDGLMLGKTPLQCDTIKVSPDKDGRVYIDRWRFRGEVDIIKANDLTLIVVNELDVEDYLYGVLYHEVSHRWPAEVLKAQAIAARTYALYQKKMMAGKDYHVTADVYSQVYGGRASEKFSTNRAVDATRGKVLTFNGDIFPAYYHATCGGFTEDASNLWKTDLPPLKGVACGFCTRSKHFHWTRKIRMSYIAEVLQKAGYPITGVSSIKIESRNPSHRINNVIITGPGGETAIPGKDFRIAIGPNLLRSNNYDVIVDRDIVVFNGIGWGHGVGMCQWGAYFMARKGYKAKQILQYYYPGAEVRDYHAPDSSTTS